MFLCERVEPGHVLLEGDGVERLGHGGEKFKQLPPGPRGPVDDLGHGGPSFLMNPVYQTGKKLQGPPLFVPEKELNRRWGCVILSFEIANAWRDRRRRTP